ncbi:hypothetical protein GCM10010191_93340 [Actinomadura vinacea]|uniref:Septum formation-related domain-containing protein n=1 Tax=Actinomadura vinacea TaxID=115336 RepID=A0ABN3KFS4_9ACTN
MNVPPNADGDSTSPPDPPNPEAVPAWTAPSASPAPPPDQPPVPPVPSVPSVPPQGTDRTNPLAIATLVTGLLGGLLITVGLGIAALAQINRRGERGRGLVVGGLAAAGVWLVVAVIAVAAVVGTAAGETADKADYRLNLKPGECFDLTAGPDAAEHKTVPCTGPHDGELILTFKLPRTEWLGDEEMRRRGTSGCEGRFQARFKTHTPVENGETYVVYPRDTGWQLGDRLVQCAITAAQGQKLAGPIGSQVRQTRALDELKPGDCFDWPKKEEAITVNLIPCDRPHGTQLTHQFDLPSGPFPGDPAAERKADAGCTAHWKKMFAKRPSPVRIDQWYVPPTKEMWDLGDRTIMCMVSGAKGRPLKRSVVPG